jgi:F-type H+-transporting ATPase subunit b
MDRYRDVLREQAREEAEQERRRLMDQARRDADAARREWGEQVTRNRHDFLDALGRRTAAAFEALARRALRDLADADLEDRLVQTLLTRLDDDDDLVDAFRGAETPLTLTTSHALDDARREHLAQALRARFGADTRIALQTSPDLLCGIELEAAGRRLGWTLADYLDGFERAVAAQLDRPAQTASGTEV